MQTIRFIKQFVYFQIKMTSTSNVYDEQMSLLTAQYPHESSTLFEQLLQRFDGNMNHVRASLVQREYQEAKRVRLENQYGPVLTEFINENVFVQSWKREHLLRLMEHFNGDIKQVRDYLQKSRFDQHDSTRTRQEQHDLWRCQYASQLSAAGFNVNSPCVLDQLDKHQGNIDKVHSDYFYSRFQR
jgi:hypothetical protein